MDMGTDLKRVILHVVNRKIPNPLRKSKSLSTLWPIILITELPKLRFYGRLTSINCYQKQYIGTIIFNIIIVTITTTTLSQVYFPLVLLNMNSPPSSAEVKECVELYLHSPNTPSWRGAQLKISHRDNFTFTLFINMNQWENPTTHITQASSFRLYVAPSLLYATSPVQLILPFVENLMNAFLVLSPDCF
jgi:hypothetical protein